MSAAEIIEQIKALSPEERALVIEFVRQADQGHASRISLIDADAFESAAARVFEIHDELLNRLAK